MAQSCQEYGHIWQITQVPGWFRCLREIGYSLKMGKVSTCGAIALCPACLGYLLRDHDVCFCALHQHVPVVSYPIKEVASTSAYTAPSAEQQSLW